MTISKILTGHVSQATWEARRAAEQRVAAERAREFQAFAAQLAAQLSGTLRPSSAEGRTYAVIDLPDVSIDVHTSREVGKVAVGVAVLSYTDARGESQRVSTYDVRHAFSDSMPSYEIRAAMSRGAVAVARDIERRQLPGARQVWAKMCERRDGAQAYTASDSATQARLEAVTGDKPGRHSNELTLWGRGASCVRVRAQGESVRFEAFNLPVDLAVEVLALLKGVQS
jgi:hypothetical protein